MSKRVQVIGMLVVVLLIPSCVAGTQFVKNEHYRCGESPFSPSISSSIEWCPTNPEGKCEEILFGEGTEIPWGEGEYRDWSCTIFFQNKDGAYGSRTLDPARVTGDHDFDSIVSSFENCEDMDNGTPVMSATVKGHTEVNVDAVGCRFDDDDGE